MTRTKLFIAGVAAFALLASVAFVNAAAEKAATEKAKQDTLANLQAAYDGESNASAKYAAFAEKADAEGYKGVAVLFRATSAAEKIHLTEHAKVIKSLGAQPKADIKKPEVKTTKENLEAALAGETYERDTMYPGFIKTAKAEGKTAAVKSFNHAASAEAEHAKLYKEAVDNLDQWKAAGKVFYVCPECGYTAAKLPDVRCPICFTPKEKFETIK